MNILAINCPMPHGLVEVGEKFPNSLITTANTPDQLLDAMVMFEAGKLPNLNAICFPANLRPELAEAMEVLGIRLA